MTDQFGRRGRRADLAEQLHDALVARGLTPLPGGARQLIDTKIRHVAAQMRMTEAVALRHFGEREVEQLAAITADDWHAAKAVADAAGEITVTVPSTDAARLVMGLAMAVGQVIREVYGDLPAAAGEPLDALCELGAAIRDGLDAEELTADVTLDVLSTARTTLERAAAGVRDGSVNVVVSDTARPKFAEQLEHDAALAESLMHLNGS